MAGGWVGDGHIDIHADERPFQREMAGVQRALRADLTKRGEALGKNLANGIGDGMASNKAPFEKAARAALRAFRAEALKDGSRAGKAIADGIADAMRDRLQERARIVGKQAVQAVKRAAVAAGPIKLQVDADTAKAREDIKKVSDNQKTVVNVDADTGKAAADMRWLTRNRRLDVWVDAHTAKARAQIAELTKGLTGWTLLMNWGQALTRLGERLPQTILKMGLLYSSLASLINPVLLLIRSIGPLAMGLWRVAEGAVAIGPAVLGAVTVFGLLKAAFSKLDENSNRFVQKASSNMKQWTENWVYVRKEIQNAFYASNRFNKAFASFGRNVVFANTFRAGLKDVSRELSNFVSVGMEGLTTSMHPGTTKAFFGGLVDGLRAANPGMLALGHAVGLIAQRGSDLFRGMGEQITRWGKSLEEWAARTDISAMARRAWEEWGALWSLLKNMGSTIGNIFVAMNPPGSSLSAIERMADTWQRVADVTGSSAFQSTMRTIFSGAAVGASALADALGPIGENLQDFAPTLRDVLGLIGKIGAAVARGLSDILGDFDFRGSLEAAFGNIQQMVEGIDFRAVADAIAHILDVIGTMAPALDEFVNAFVSVADGIIVSVLPVLREFSAWVQANPGVLRELIVTLVAAKVAFAGLGAAMSLANLAGLGGAQGFRSLGGFLAAAIPQAKLLGAVMKENVARSVFGAVGPVRSLTGTLGAAMPVLGAVGPAALIAAAAFGTFAVVRMSNQQRIAALEAERATVDDYVAALKRGAKNGGRYLAEIDAQLVGFSGAGVDDELNSIAEQIRYLSTFKDNGLTDWIANLVGSKQGTQQAREELTKLSEALAGADFTTASGAFKQIADAAAVSQVEMVTFTTGYGSATEAVTRAGVALTDVAQNPAFAEFRGKLQEIAAAYGVTSLSAADFDEWMAGKIPDAMRKAVASSPQVTAALSEVDAGFAGVNASAYSMAQALVDPDTAARQLAETVQTAIDRIYGLQSAQNSLAGGVSNFYSQLTNAKIAAANLGDGIELTNAAGAANAAVLEGIATSTKSVITQMAQQGATTEEITTIADKARKTYLDQYVAAVSGAKNYKSANEDVKKAARDAAEAAGLIPGKKVVDIIAQVTGLAQVTDIDAQIRGLQTERDLLINVDTPEAKKRIAEIDAESDRLVAKRRKVVVDYGIDTTEVDQYKPRDKDGNVIVGVDDRAWRNYNPTNKRAVIRLGVQLAEADGGILRGFANGGLMRSVRAFASGAERHIAQIAPAGAMRLWAEPETGGEAYIPLAASKRARSRQIWAQTGRELDMYADGGLSGPAAAAYAGGGKFIGMMTLGGLLTGLKSGEGALSAALMDPMKKALEDLRNFMGIHSDSDTMIVLGGNITSGTATGIVKMGPKVSKAVRELVKKYLINSADFEYGAAAFQKFGSDLALALSYGLRDGGALLDEVLSGMARKATEAIDGEIDRITKLTEASNAKLSAAKKKANSAGDKALNAQIKKNKAALEKQVELLQKYKTAVDKEFEAQSATSDLAIWWALGDEAGAKEMAKWANGTSSIITSATLGDIEKAQEVLRGMLDDAKSLRDSVASSLTSGLSLKGLTNVRQLTSTLSSWASRATMFAGKLKELAKKGYPAAFIQQVAGLGFADGPGVADALLAASAADVAQINTDYSTLMDQANAIGNTVVDAMYGVGADATVGFIDGLQSDLAALSAAGESLGATLVAAVAKGMGVDLPVPSSIALTGLNGLSSTAALGAPVSFSGLGTSGSTAGTATVTQTGTTLVINGSLIGANPKVEQAVRLLLEVIGDTRRIERAGQPITNGV